MTMLTHDGITQPVEEWALDYGIPADLIASRLKRGWTVERAITEPMLASPGAKLPAPPHKPPRKPRKPVGRYHKRKMIEFNGETLSVIEWAERLGIHANAIRSRLRKGWTSEQALTTEKNATRKPSRTGGLIEFNGERHIITEWSRRLGMDIGTLSARLKRGWTVQKAFTEPVDSRRGRSGREPARSRGYQSISSNRKKTGVLPSAQYRA